MTRRALRTASALLLATALAVAACARDIVLGSDVTSGGAPSGATGGGGASGHAGAGTAGQPVSGGAAGAPERECVKAMCHGMTYLCGDCMDNDGDGKIDAEDPECTGPCDDREDSFDVGLPGSSADKCAQDCFFDNGNGAGDDGCRFSHQCDPLSVAPDYPPTGSAACAYDENAKVPGGTETCAELRAEQAPSCATKCTPLTPNGCDCFGCCDLSGGNFHFVGLGAGASPCTVDNLDDPEACPPCMPVESCLNKCDPCESCVGRPEPLASCTGTPACPDTLKQCDFGGSKLCSQGFYCVTGCCVAEPR